MLASLLALGLASTGVFALVHQLLILDDRRRARRQRRWEREGGDL